MDAAKCGWVGARCEKCGWVGARCEKCGWVGARCEKCMCNVYVRLSTNSTISLDTIVLFVNGYLVVDNKSNFINYTLSTEALRDMSPTVRQIVIRHCHLYIVPKLRHKCIRPYKFPHGMYLYSANRLRINYVE